MAFVVTMPRLGLNEEENVLSEWLVKEGDAVAAGDALFSLETDKSSLEVYAEQSGTVLKCLYGELDVVPVMKAVCIIGEPGEDIGSILNSMPSSASQTPEAVTPAVEEKAAEPVSARPVQESLADITSKSANAPVSPRARKLAKANGINTGGLAPSGAEGRIIEEDIISAMKSVPRMVADSTPSTEMKPVVLAKTSGGKTVKTSNIRRIIANNIFNSLKTTAQTTQHMRFNASRLQSYRAWLKASPGPEKDITLNELISYITVKTLEKFDFMNAHMHSVEEITLFGSVNLGCAVGTEKGLLVPTVKNAQTMSLTEFAKTLKTLIQKTRDGQIKPDEMADATFTISNLGGYGVTTFTPVLNPPQVGILGVGTIDYAVKNTPDGILYYPAGYLSLTYDHRAMDGVPAAEFFRALCGNLESMDMLSSGE